MIDLPIELRHMIYEYIVMTWHVRRKKPSTCPRTQGGCYGIARRNDEDTALQVGYYIDNTGTSCEDVFWNDRWGMWARKCGGFDYFTELDHEDAQHLALAFQFLAGYFIDGGSLKKPLPRQSSFMKSAALEDFLDFYWGNVIIDYGFAAIRKEESDLAVSLFPILDYRVVYKY